MKRLCAVVMVCVALCCGAGAAWGLSNAEYLAFMRISPEFKEADAELNAAFTQAKKKLSGADLSAFLESQKFFIEYTMDDIANALIKDDNIDRLRAYTAVTKLMAKKVKIFIDSEWKKEYVIRGVIQKTYLEEYKYAIEYTQKKTGKRVKIYIHNTERNNKMIDESGYGVGDKCEITTRMDIYISEAVHIVAVKPPGTYEKEIKKSSNKQKRPRDIAEEDLTIKLEQWRQMAKDLMS